METTPRTDIHASDIVEETQNRLHTAKHALTKQLVRIIAQICGWNAENKRDKHQNTQCYVLTKATIHKLQCDLIAISGQYI